MKKEDFKELQNNHWCAIAWEACQKKPNLRLVRYRLTRIARILGLPKRRFDDKEVRKIMGISERIASSLNKDYVTRKSSELILGNDAREMEILTLK